MAKPVTRQARAILFWSLLFALGGQLALAVLLECRQTRWIDPEYGTRLERLKEQVAAGPDRPLVLLLGSSHVGSNVNTDILPPADAGPHPPLVFNWSQSGAGPFLELLYLRRALAQGIRPKAVVIEVLPVMLHNEGLWMDDPSFDPNYLEPRRVRWSDLWELRRCEAGAVRLHFQHWLEHHSAPSFFHRAALLTRLAPWLLERTWGPATWEGIITASGRNPCPKFVTSEQQRTLTQGTHDFYQPNMAFMAVHPRTDEVLRELLDLCLREQIVVCALIRTPESSEFRGWYRPETRDLINGYLTKLAHEYGTRYVDASDWVPDPYFVDGHHLLDDGANLFTQRFWQEVVVPGLR
jgi:hypothetical protein